MREIMNRIASKVSLSRWISINEFHARLKGVSTGCKFELFLVNLLSSKLRVAP